MGQIITKNLQLSGSGRRATIADKFTNQHYQQATPVLQREENDASLCNFIWLEQQSTHRLRGTIINIKQITNNKRRDAKPLFYN